MDFTTFSTSIADLHDALRAAAVTHVNRMLTMRNWIIGMYMVEYEQRGEDRAEYGSELLEKLSSDLMKKEVKGVSVTALRNCRQFYLVYKRFESVFIQSPEINRKPAFGSISSPFVPPESGEQRQFIASQKRLDASLQAEILINNFSFSHFIELMRLDAPQKRTFYEIEGIKGCWSVLKLKRQIENMLYERTGLSRIKQKSVDTGTAEKKNPAIDYLIRDPYILEFTGLPERTYYSESDLEIALLDHIQSFLLEPGNGFCFEARQKRVTRDNEHERIDLVFYHRILRCHVLIDLKTRSFMHSDEGQMNFFLNYYRENEMAEGDNPPVGLILCTGSDKTEVRYVTGGMDNQFFISTYLSLLPSEDQITVFFEADCNRTETLLREQQGVYQFQQETI